MITAIVNLDLYRYEIHSLIKAFYPQEEVKVLLEEDAGKWKYQQIAREPFLRVVFAEEGVTAVFCDGSEKKTAPAPAGISYAGKGQELKTALKHLLYGMLSGREGRTLPWGELIGIRPAKLAMQYLQGGMSRAEAAAAMERDHLVSPEKAALAAQIAWNERRILSGIHYEDGYSLYVGIPFCPTTCLYCSFPSFNLTGWKDRVDTYLDRLELEMRASSGLMQGKTLDTVYIGGGTPTTLEAAQLDRLFCMLEKYFPMRGILEFTVEAGRPDSITAEKLRVIREYGASLQSGQRQSGPAPGSAGQDMIAQCGPSQSAGMEGAGTRGVTRISVNPQTMKEETLRLIGRRHTVDQVREAFALCREAGFDDINMDIILGLPQETQEDVKRTLEEIEKLSPDSLTVHSLALKRGSRMQKLIEEKGYSFLSRTDGCVELAAQAAARMGMEPYYLYRQKNISGNLENVGYALPGKAGIYNILIMEEKQTILALGAGSITKAVFPGGRIERSDNCKDVATYMENIDEMIGRKVKLLS